MESLYHGTNRSLGEVHNLFRQCERQGTTTHTLHEMAKRLEQVGADCVRLDALVQKEPVQRRQNAKTRVDQLR